MRSGGEAAMARDDWKYDEDLWKEEVKEETKPAPQKQCPRCLHFVPGEATYCTWCGRPFEDR